MKKANTETADRKVLDGAQSLAASIDRFKKMLAEDIDKACDSKETFTLLSSKNDEKVLNQVLKLITIFDGGGKVTDKLKSPVMDEITPNEAIAPTKEVEKGVKLKPGGNIYEHALEHVKNGRSRI